MWISSAMVFTSTPLLELEVGHSAFWPRRHQIYEIPILNPQLKSLRILQRRFFSIHRHQTIYRRRQLRLKFTLKYVNRKFREFSRILYVMFLRNKFVVVGLCLSISLNWMRRTNDIWLWQQSGKEGLTGPPPHPRFSYASNVTLLVIGRRIRHDNDRHHRILTYKNHE